MNAGRILALAVALLVAAGPVSAQPIRSDAKVKVAAKGVKADGRTTVTITLDVEKGWYVLANQIGNEDLASDKTEVSLSAGDKKVSAKVKYPTGETKTDKLIGDYAIYTGRVTITAVVDTLGPVEVKVRIRAFRLRGDPCLPPAVIKLKVE